MADFLSDKIQGKLRSIGRSSATVNAMRSAGNGALKVAESSEKPLEAQLQSFDPEESIKHNSVATRKLKKGKNDAAREEIEVQGFAILRDARDSLTNQVVKDQRGRICTFSGSLADIDKLADDKRVVAIKMADSLREPDATTEGIGTSSDTSRTADAAHLADKHKYGKNILIGCIDVGGLDFAHKDFLDEQGKTRFVRIWDQGGTYHNPPNTGRFDYGSEIRAEDMNEAIWVSDQIGVPAHRIEPQSQMSRGSHATHVTSIAAGNSGICSKAKIAGVLLSLPKEDYHRRRSFYDTTRVVDAVEYLLSLAEDLGVDAVTINISLGTNGGGHDDSAPMSRWIDQALTTPGRAVCVAAGNSGQEAPQHARDIGFVTGRIHTSGRLAATGLSNVINWVVVGNQIEDISENELEIWYEPQDRMSVQVQPPGGEWSTVIAPGEALRNQLLSDGTVLSVFSELYDSGNGCNKISIYLAPFQGTPFVGITPGVWRVRLIGTQIRDGRYHGWIERDDPFKRGGTVWQFPSFFTPDSNVDSHSISTLGCGARVIAVANYDRDNEQINISSSQGPTRDGRQKPDIAAPGTRIVAANGFEDDADWTSKTGTSMASPYVAGAIGLMQATGAAEGLALTSAQLIGILRRTASPLPGHDFNWRNDTGFGAIDLKAALDEVLNAATKTNVI